MPDDHHLRLSADVMETAFSEAPLGIAIIGLDGRFLQVNRALCEMLGRSEDEVVGSTSAPFTHPDDLAVTADAFRHLNASRAALEVEKRYLRPDGEVVWASTKGTRVHDAKGNGSYVVAHFKDITTIRAAEQARAQAQAQFELAFSAAPIGMALVGLDGRFVKVNRALCALVGLDEASLLGEAFSDVIHPEDADLDRRQRKRLLAGDIDRYSIEKRFLDADGNRTWANLSAAVVRDDDGSARHFIIQLEDISERRRLEAKLQRLAHFDPLTDLWNRRRFEDELRRQVGRCRRYGDRAALLVIDLNGFKPINDRFGHEAGDLLLAQTARTLRTRLRETDSIGRLGGDEFAVLLNRISVDEAAALADVLRAAIADASVDFGGVPLSVTASVGVTFLDERTASAEVALAQADSAMYDAKAARTDTRNAGLNRGAGAAESRRSRREADVGATERPLRILHCDDSADYRHLLREMLSVQPGVEVTAEAASAAEAIVAARSFDGEIILLDASLEDADGGLIAQLRRAAPGARVIALSGMDPAHTPLGEDADAFVHKSASFDALVAVLRAPPGLPLVV